MTTFGALLPLAQGGSDWFVPILLVGIIFYFIVKMFRASQGVDVTLAFKEIPIE